MCNGACWTEVYKNKFSQDFVIREEQWCFKEHNLWEIVPLLDLVTGLDTTQQHAANEQAKWSSEFLQIWQHFECRLQQEATKIYKKLQN